MQFPFENRPAAARRLAESLRDYAGRTDVLVLGLPRGGVGVGYEVAEVLAAPLDVLVVRKLGLPGQEELAIGAIATGGARILNRQLIEELNVGDEVIDAVIEREQQELRRRELLYRGDQPAAGLAGRCLVFVDDGLATGATMLAAASAARQQDPARVVVAVPVAPVEAVDALRHNVDQVVCLASPQPFGAVSRWYRHFPQTTDDEVRRLLSRARDRRSPPAAE